MNVLNRFRRDRADVGSFARRECPGVARARRRCQGPRRNGWLAPIAATRYGKADAAKILLAGRSPHVVSADSSRALRCIVLLEIPKCPRGAAAALASSSSPVTRSPAPSSMGCVTMSRRFPVSPRFAVPPNEDADLFPPFPCRCFHGRTRRTHSMRCARWWRRPSICAEGARGWTVFDVRCFR